MSVWNKILVAQKAIGHVAKNGRNDYHKYDYAMEADILDCVKKAANEAGLIIMTSTQSEIGVYTIEKGKTREGYDIPNELIRWAKVTLAYSIVDAETGEAQTGTFDGYAEDKGDKAVYKATTGANKYFLMKFFGVPTGDDPEKDDSGSTKDDSGSTNEPAKTKTNKPPQTKNYQTQKPVEDRVIENPKKTCSENVKAILNLQKQQGWTDQEVLNYSGLMSLKELVAAGTVQAADELGRAYLLLLSRAQKAS